MANCDGSSSFTIISEDEVAEEELLSEYGSGSGWVEALTSCDHLNSLSSQLSQIPSPDTPCNKCHNLVENWLCLCCKEVLCSRFVNKHMLEHYQQQNHCLALSFSDLSVWCFSCNAYLDAQAIVGLRPVYETAYHMKFGDMPPVRSSSGSGSDAGGSSVTSL